MKIALIGATGLVGAEMMRVLEEQQFSLTGFYAAASERSVGREVVFGGRSYRVMGLEEALEAGPDIALFSAGGSVSRAWAGRFAEAGCFVIDNSSAWRMEPGVPLVVPEVNAHAITPDTRIIANPNCSTIQLVVALAPLHRRYGIRRVVVATYQSVTGTGVQAVRQLHNERAGIDGPMAYPHVIDLNCFPHGGDFLDNGYTTEEMKLVNETRKIMEAPQVQITATVVRIPVVGGHSEAVNVAFEKEYELQELRQLLEQSPGIVLQDDPLAALYPMPRSSQGRDQVFVGRLRRDISQQNGLDMWIVADNLRKGAATNAVQIAQYLVKENLTA